MKIDAPQHPKVKYLQRILDVPFPMVIGYLELFWKFTATYAPQGDVGKYDNEFIASACYYEGKADDFIRALVKARLVDEDPAHRLLVHDWADHIEAWVKSKLTRAKLEVLSPTPAHQDDLFARPSRDGRAPALQEKSSVEKGREEQLSAPHEQTVVVPISSRAPPVPHEAYSLSDLDSNDQKAPALRCLQKDQQLNIGWFMQAQAARKDLSEEQIRKSWERFIDHHLARGTRFADPLVGWISWVKNERSESGPGGAGGMPRDDNQLEAWARAHGLPGPKPGESYPQYRARLSSMGESRHATG